MGRRPLSQAVHGRIPHVEFIEKYFHFPMGKSLGEKRKESLEAVEMGFLLFQGKGNYLGFKPRKGVAKQRVTENDITTQHKCCYVFGWIDTRDK